MGIFSAENAINSFGLIGIFAILFVETGLPVVLGLPGDSLLFLAGVSASGTGEKLNVHLFQIKSFILRCLTLKVYFQDLKRQSLDSVENYKQQLIEKESLLKLETQNFETLKAQADLTQIALNQSLQKENSITLFGAAISKKKYNLIL